jgi:protein CpxP
MKNILLSTFAQRGVRRAVLTTALALTSAASMLAGTTVGMTSAQAQGQPTEPRDQPDRGSCKHHGGQEGHEGHGAHMSPLGPLGDARMLDDVKATDAQRAKIKQIAEAAKKDLQAQHESARDLHEKTMQILNAPKVDEAAAESVRQQMLAQHDKASKRGLQALIEISRVLTPEQRAQVAQRMKDRSARAGQGPKQ